MRVADVMQRDVVTVGPNTDVEAVMREHELPGLPVVNDGGRLVGIVTESDLVLGDDDRDLHLPHHLDLLGARAVQPLRGSPAQGVREPSERHDDARPGDDRPDADVRDAARVIAESGHNRVPVVEHGRFVGLVTRLDVLEALSRS